MGAGWLLSKSSLFSCSVLLCAFVCKYTYHLTLFLEKLTQIISIQYKSKRYILLRAGSYHAGFKPLVLRFLPLFSEFSSSHDAIRLSKAKRGVRWHDPKTAKWSNMSYKIKDFLFFAHFAQNLRNFAHVSDLNNNYPFAFLGFDILIYLTSWNKNPRFRNRHFQILDLFSIISFKGLIFLQNFLQ